MKSEEIINEAVKRLRESNESIYKLARIISVTPAPIYSWRLGKTRPTLENAEKLIAYFDNPDAFVIERKKKNNDPKPINNNEAPTNVSPSIIERAMEIVMKRCNDLEIERDALREQLDAAREEIARLRGLDGDN